MGIKLKPELKKQNKLSQIQKTQFENKTTDQKEQDVDDNKQDEGPPSDMKRNSIVSLQDENSVGNSTIHRKPDNMLMHQSSDVSNLKKIKNNSKSSSPTDNIRYQQQRTPTPNQHYNDTMFGDEVPRTYSPNELDSLRHVYQNNVTAHSEDERENNSNREYIDDNLYEDETENEENTDNLNDANFRNYQATAKSEDDLVIDNRDSWDPNNTNRLPKEGNENNVIIEISNFNLKENSQVLKRDDIQNLFVGMEFLNYDPAELEAQNSMPKPSANQPVHFNFRKSKILKFLLYQLNLFTNLNILI
jgi:hypothetical protein